jgi:hypothetical protein
MSLQNELLELKTRYNFQQALIEADLKREDGFFQSYNESTQLKKKKEKFDKNLEAHKEKFSSFADKIKREKSDTLNKILSLKFPNISSKDSNQKLIGEQQLTQAQLFLNSPHSTNQIISTIKNAFDSNRLEYGFSVFDAVLDAIPDSKTTQLTDDQKNLKDALQKVYEGFKGYSEIESAKKDIAEIESIRKTTGILIDQLNEGRNYIQHFTRQEVDSMTLDQMKDSQILDAIGESMAKWKETE